MLKVECADKNGLPNRGYIEVNIKAPGIPRSTGHECLLLVVPDTSYNHKSPILFGTNVISSFLDECKSQCGQQYLQRGKLHVPGFLAFRCMHLREKELKRNLNRSAVLRSSESGNVFITPNQNVNIRCKTDQELNHHSTCSLIESTVLSSLLKNMVVTPAVVNFVPGLKREYTVTIMNLTNRTVCVSPHAILSELQPVDIDDCVFNNLESEPVLPDIFKNVNMNVDLSESQHDVLLALLRNTKIFSQPASRILENVKWGGIELT